jgi:hypothetical protein
MAVFDPEPTSFIHTSLWARAARTLPEAGGSRDKQPLCCFSVLPPGHCAYLEGPGWWSTADTRWTLSSASRSSSRALRTGTRRWQGCRTDPGYSTCPSPWRQCSLPDPGGTGGNPPLGTWWWTWPWPVCAEAKARERVLPCCCPTCAPSGRRPGTLLIRFFPSTRSVCSQCFP